MIRNHGRVFNGYHSAGAGGDFWLFGRLPVPNGGASDDAPAIMKLPSPLLLGLIYLVSEILLAVTRRARGRSTSQDANSLRLLWIVISVSIWFGIFVAQASPAATLPHRHLFAVLGLVLFVLGLVVRWSSIIHLGRFFTVDVAIAADHRLIESGPYRYVRHPSYTGSLLAFLGFSLSLGNWLSLLIITFPIFLAFLYRMHVEERALIAGLGDNYAAYQRRTKRLLPFVY